MIHTHTHIYIYIYEVPTMVELLNLYMSKKCCLVFAIFRNDNLSFNSKIFTQRVNNQTLIHFRPSIIIIIQKIELYSLFSKRYLLSWSIKSDPDFCSRYKTHTGGIWCIWWGIDHFMQRLWAAFKLYKTIIRNTNSFINEYLPHPCAIRWMWVNF